MSRLPNAVHLRHHPRLDGDRGVELLDDRGAFDGRSRGERGAVVDGGLVPRAVEADLTHAGARIVRARAVLRGGERGEIERLAAPDHGGAKVHEHRDHLGQRDVEAALVVLGEGRPDPLGVEPRVDHGDAEHVALAPVEHVRLVHHVDGGDCDPFGFDEGASLRRLLVEDGLPERGADVGERPVQRTHVVVAHVGEHAAERGGNAGESRDEHVGDSELAGDGRSVHRTRSAEREEDELARVVALLDRDHPRRVGHLVVRDREDRRRRILRIQSKRLPDGLDDARTHPFEVRRSEFAGERGGVDAPEHRVRVGDRRGIAAPSVADGAGARAGALRADPEQPAGVDTRDAAATRADGVDVDEREMQRHRVRQVLLVRDRRTAVADEGEVEARAAHVAGEHVVEAGRPAEPGRRNRAGRRSGQHRLGRGPARGPRGHHPPVALHEQELVPESRVGEPPLGGPDVARHQRLHPAVQGGRARALELADFRQHFHAGADVRVRPQLARDLGRAPLVGRVGVGVYEVDDQGLAARVAKSDDGRAELVFVEREDDPPLCVHALGHVEPQLARNQRLEAPRETPSAGPGAPAELEGVAESAGGDEPALRALAFQDRVGGDGGAVHDGLDRCGGRTARIDTRHEAVGLRAGGARDFGDLESTRLPVEGEHVGEGAADVHTDSVSGLRFLVCYVICHWVIWTIHDRTFRVSLRRRKHCISARTAKPVPSVAPMSRHAARIRQTPPCPRCASRHACDISTAGLCTPLATFGEAGRFGN